MLYNRQGEYAKALPLFEECLDARTKVLGPSHPDTVGSKQWLEMCRAKV